MSESVLFSDGVWLYRWDETIVFCFFLLFSRKEGMSLFPSEAVAVGLLFIGRILLVVEMGV